MSNEQYDLAIIGAGAAGSSAASVAAKAGRRVALIERDHLGGTCHNYGCDPTKTLLHVAQLRFEAQHAEQYGLRIGAVESDWSAVQAWVANVLQQMQGGSDEDARQSIRDQGIDLFIDEARFVTPHELAVDDRHIRADQIIIATGMAAAVPDIPGLHETGYITNVEAVSLPQLPRRLAVVGGGALGAEFAQMFSRFDVAVTVVEQSNTLLDTEDRELSERLGELLVNEGICVELGAELTRVERGGDGKQLTFTRDGKQHSLVIDEILLALGRQPQLEALRLDVAGVETTKKGITVDETLRTNVPHIWAAGDITGMYPFTQVAAAHGWLAAHNAFAAPPRRFNKHAVPWATYTDPELAHVGQTEEQLKHDGVAYRVGRALLKENDRALATGYTEGMVKILVGDDGSILGGHVLAAHGGEMLAPIVVAMRHGLTVDALADTLLPYPTLSEAVLSACKNIAS